MSQSLPAGNQGLGGITALSVQPGQPEPGFLECGIQLERRAVTTLGGRKIQRGQVGSGDSCLSLRGRRRCHGMFPDLTGVGRAAQMQKRRCHPVAGWPIGGDSTILSLAKQTGGRIGVALLEQFTNGTDKAIPIGSVPVGEDWASRSSSPGLLECTAPSAAGRYRWTQPHSPARSAHQP